MAGITRTQAEANLTALLTASAKEDGSASVSLPDGRSVTYRGLSEITEAIQFWDLQVKRLSRGGIAIRGVSPL